MCQKHKRTSPFALLPSKTREVIGPTLNHPGRQPLAIVGTSSFGEDARYHVVACIESLDRSRRSLRLHGIPVPWPDEIDQLPAGCRGLCAVGSPRRLDCIRQVRERRLPCTTSVHASAQVSASTRLGVMSQHEKTSCHSRGGRGAMEADLPGPGAGDGDSSPGSATRAHWGRAVTG
ncbi:MAG: hypothetical protein Q9Q40_09615 [Acidobacteriota bacterium]|nr:hypothetical protein [Acidobacteriota bacterium]MDQ7087070.1 hypothetical protein [Acidobacteriota bacterium]